MLYIISIIYFLLPLIFAQTSSDFLKVGSLLNSAAKDFLGNVINEPKDTSTIQKEYDFIIIGAGTAGCTLANRLTEVPEWNVLLIEAGGPENFAMDIPIIANVLQFTKANWLYKTEPSASYCLAMDNEQCHWPRGKVMGGSSVLNYMIYTKGNRRDYDGWEAQGNKGWGWNNVSHYFKKMEDMAIPEIASGRLHGTNGYLTVSEVPYKTKIADAFVNSAREMGHPIVDFNGPTQIGFNYLQTTMRNGTRWSSSRAYLYPIHKRPNLHVKKYSQVTKIVIDPKTKVTQGVEFVNSKRKYFVKAKNEVILSGGAINSPQLLMLSGIGPKRHLHEKNIKLIKNSKVGYNLQDHTVVGGLSFLINFPYTLEITRLASNPRFLADYINYHKGPYSIPGGCEALGFLDLQNINDPDGYPDMELLLVSGGLTSAKLLYKNFNLNKTLFEEMYDSIKDKEEFMILPISLRPKSVGRIMLKDNNPFSHPLIFPNYFSDPEGYDVKTAIAGVRATIKLSQQPSFMKLGMRLYDKVFPPCQHLVFDSDDYWECYARHFTFTMYHHVGTCKMGPANDPDAVVDDRLRVRGIKKLRVIDASIMPYVPAAHTNAPTFMIAEKGSDIIKEDWGRGVKT